MKNKDDNSNIYTSKDFEEQMRAMHLDIVLHPYDGVFKDIHGNEWVQLKKLEDKPALTFNEIRSVKGSKWEPLTYVDATPDEDYAIRIIESHLKNSQSGRWFSPDNQKFADMMNDLQDQRVVILEKALNKLKFKE